MKGPMALTAELVARCERNEPDPGPANEYIRYVDKDYAIAADRLLAAAPDGPLWIFAYGSLIWKPAVHTTDHRRATAHGWHRAFCLRLRRYRGSPEQPGLMMGLKRGGTCVGMIHRLADDERRAPLIQLLEREVGSDAHVTGVRWINVRTATGPARALAFWAEPEGLPEWVDVPMDEVAHILARACGHVGSGAAYLFNTVAHLEALGIRDRNLWRLQQMVAEEIRRLPASNGAAPAALAESDVDEAMDDVPQT